MDGGVQCAVCSVQHRSISKLDKGDSLQIESEPTNGRDIFKGLTAISSPGIRSVPLKAGSLNKRRGYPSI